MHIQHQNRKQIAEGKEGVIWISKGSCESLATPFNMVGDSFIGR